MKLNFLSFAPEFIEGIIELFGASILLLLAGVIEQFPAPIFIEAPLLTMAVVFYIAAGGLMIGGATSIGRSMMSLINK